ncbi:hypothetical protein [Thermomonospora catenispora]|uniref:hypothetical protein n=1 Tax=Thermomonospora catenispora TaxID=2493090 RepID=UPI0015886848|nr:hypothetical protein [Thermomonospora catenispora]
MNGSEYAYVDDAFNGDVLERPEDAAAMKRTGKHSVQKLSRRISRSRFRQRRLKNGRSDALAHTSHSGNGGATCVESARTRHEAAA